MEALKIKSGKELQEFKNKEQEQRRNRIRELMIKAELTLPESEELSGLEIKFEEFRKNND